MCVCVCVGGGGGASLLDRINPFVGDFVTADRIHAQTAT